MGKVTQSQIYARTHLDIKPKMRCNGRLLRANYQHDAMIYSLKKIYLRRREPEFSDESNFVNFRDK